MPTNEQLEEMIHRVDAHHASVIKAVEDKLDDRIKQLQNQVNALLVEVQQLKTRR